MHHNYPPELTKRFILSLPFALLSTCFCDLVQSVRVIVF
jgi:hypothetical protein